MKLIDSYFFLSYFFFFDLPLGWILLYDFFETDLNYSLFLNFFFLKTNILENNFVDEQSIFLKTNYFTKLLVSSLSILLTDTNLLVDDKEWVFLTYGNEEIIRFFFKNLFSFSEMEMLLKDFSDINYDTNYFVFESNIRWLDNFEKRFSQNQLFYYYNNLFQENEVLKNLFTIFFYKNKIDIFSLVNESENFDISKYIYSAFLPDLILDLNKTEKFSTEFFEKPFFIFSKNKENSFLFEYSNFLCKNIYFYENYLIISSCLNYENNINDIHNLFFLKISFFDLICISNRLNYLDDQTFTSIVTSKLLIDYIKLTINFQLQFLELMEVIFWKKMFNFLSNNLFIIGLMFLAIISLYKSINLIYALLSFLLFAIFSGLLILLWGNEYLGLCVLLIYGAAIPVLALYIIMLVNVDLIQRLFFYEKLVRYNFKVEFLALFFSFTIIFLLIMLSNNSLFFFYHERNYFFSSLLKYSFYLTLSWRYLNTSDISYSIDNVLDLTTNFFLTDIDKVAGAAFQSSYNELFSLVFLLLIAIIVVISISRVTTSKWWERILFYLNERRFEKDIKDFYANTIADFKYSVEWIDIDSYLDLDKDICTVPLQDNFLLWKQLYLQQHGNLKYFKNMTKIKLHRTIGMLNDEYHYTQLFWRYWLNKFFFLPVPIEYWAEYWFSDVSIAFPDLDIPEFVHSDAGSDLNYLHFDSFYEWFYEYQEEAI